MITHAARDQLVAGMTIQVVQGDLTRQVLAESLRTRIVAWDIETTGMDWKNDRIATCQVCINGKAFVVRDLLVDPVNLKNLLAATGIKKIFHHAMFDLRFMCQQWHVRPQNVACTKVLSKILQPGEEDHSLKSLLERHLQTSITKELQLSNWAAAKLTQEQIRYAVEDVTHLERLFDVLCRQAKAANRWTLAERCFDFIPTQVELELVGCRRVFEH